MFPFGSKSWTLRLEMIKLAEKGIREIEFNICKKSFRASVAIGQQVLTTFSKHPVKLDQPRAGRKVPLILSFSYNFELC